MMWGWVGGSRLGGGMLDTFLVFVFFGKTVSFVAELCFVRLIKKFSFVGPVLCTSLNKPILQRACIIQMYGLESSHEIHFK